LRRRQLFVAAGEAGAEERAAIRARLDELRRAAEKEFPLSEAEVTTMMEELSELVVKVGEVEREALEGMQGVLSK
jgi:hypothetical protein